VNVRSIARKYANALDQVARKNGTSEAAARDMASLVSMLDGHPDLERVLASPLVPPARKRAVVEALLGVAPDTSAEVGRLLLLLADRDRFTVIREIAAEYAQLVMEAKREVSGELVTAVPVDTDRKARLAEALSRATGQRVLLGDRVDPAIVAGVVATIGGVVYDGSAARYMEVMKQKLAADA
jgi:F-type H+-transporting ATPase subunit delta